MYGFVMRISKNFKNASTYICLYKSLIRSQLEYAVPIWNPYYNKYNDALEKVQKKFLRCINHKCSRGYLTYEQLLHKYQFTTLKHRRIQLGATFLYDLCHNRYDCVPIINKICYKVPTRTHARTPCRLFATPRCRTNAGKRSPLLRLVHTYNEMFHTIDIAGIRPSVFKKNIVDILSYS